MQTRVDDVRVVLQGGLVGCDIVSGGQTVFTATVPQFELWKLRAWLRERRDINSDLRLRAVYRLELVEAEVWRRIEESEESEQQRTDWMVAGMVAMHVVAVVTLIAWLGWLFFSE